MSDKLAGTV